MADVNRQADEWLEKHPDATPKEAFVAGYWAECDNWIQQKR